MTSKTWLNEMQQPVAKIFSDRVASGATPGSVYAVFDSDGIVFGEGFGVATSAAAGEGAPPTLDTAFRIASCTKSFTAAALLILRDRGLVSLDDPIDSHLTVGPFLLDGIPMDAPTVGMLLSMSGGLPTDDPWADRLEPMTAGAFDAMARDGFRLITIPGTAYEYSNLGFALIGRLIEKLTGRSYVEVVNAELLAPLGLSGIGYDTGVEGTDGIATGFVRRDGEWLAMPEPGPGAFSPIGGLYASARGLAAWASWLSDGFTVSPDPSPVLGRPTRREMQQACRTIAIDAGESFLGRGYGYGLVAELDAQRRRVVSHSGGYPGFGSHMRWNPESGIGIIAFENARYSPMYQLATTALELILDARPVPAEVTLWPETAAAREAVEQLLVTWDDTLAASFSAPNVHMDEPFPLRRQRLEALVGQAGISVGSLRPLAESDPTSESGAHIAWTVAGEAGAVRLELRMTPEARPLVETLNVSAT